MVARSLLVIPLACAAAAVARPGADGERPTGALATCAQQSLARFPHAFTSAGNLVAGPFVLVGGGRLTTADTVRMFGGNKFPVLVAAGHRVTVELTRRTRRFASLGYGPLPRNRTLAMADGHRVVTFDSCDRRTAGSDASGRPVTFWSGFVLAQRPRCVALRVWVDAERTPRRVRLPLGRRCSVAVPAQGRLGGAR